MFINKKFKYFLLILLLIVFGILIYFSIVTNNYRIAKGILKSEINIEELKRNLKEEQKFDLEIKLNNNQTYYNEVQDAYFYYIDVEKANTYIDLKLKILSKEKYKYVVNNEKYDEKKGFFIDFEKPIELIIYNDDSYYETMITFSSLPILNIKTVHEIPPYYQDTDIEVFSKNYENPNKMYFIESDALMKIRGGISWQYPKKQYKITLTYGDNKNKLSLLGMKSDEDYILDAMFSDFSKIRTKLSFDIWNEINSYETDYTEIDVNSEYIEVYINQQYHGLYLLKEFVDWKKLGVNEFTENNTGIVIKGIEYSDWNQEIYEKDKMSYHVLRI